MVDALVAAGALEGAVGVLGPAFAPSLEAVGAVPLPGLGAEAVAGQGPHGQHDVGMRALGAVAGRRTVDGQVGHHAAPDEFLPDEAPHQLEPLLARQLAGQRHLDLAGELGILALLGGLDGVPQLGAVLYPLGRVVGGEDLAVLDAALAAVVEHHPGAVIGDAVGSTIGGGAGGTAPGAPPDDLGRQMISRQRLSTADGFQGRGARPFPGGVRGNAPSVYDAPTEAERG